MRRSSFTWLSSLWLAVVLPLAPAAAEPPWLCLPPVFDGGQRLHQTGAPRVFWLELLLRQHELCRAARADEARIFLLGSSAAFGFPLPVEQSFGSLLNERFASDGVPARLFNLCSVFPYQLRDALILREALPYEPDLIVYAITPSEFVHIAPAQYPPPLVTFFERNRDAMVELIADPPQGLGDAFDRYRFLLRRPEIGSFERLREVGVFVRVAAGEYARALARRLEPSLPPEPLEAVLTTRQKSYDCAQTKEKIGREFDGWKAWSILPHLAELRTRLGVPVLIAHWPIAHEPVGDCYNVRLTNALVLEFTAWLRAETERLGLPYVDLHDYLAAEEFLDSLHVTSEGHRRIAARMAEAIVPLLRGAAANREERGASRSRGRRVDDR
jgi:hypothetical protein